MRNKYIWVKIFVPALVILLSVSVMASAVTVTFAHYWPAFLEEGLQAVADRYQELNPEVEIEFRFVPYVEFATKFMVQAAAGVAADVNLVEQGWQGILFANGLALDLGPYIERGDWDIDRFFPGILESLGQYDGKQVGMPHIVEREAISVNLDLLEDAGIGAPGYDWTWDEALSIAEKVHNPENDVYGLMYLIANIFRYESPLRGIPWIKDGKGNWTSPEMEALCEWWDENLRSLMPPLHIVNPWLSGNVAVYSTGIARALAPVEVAFDWEVRPIPRVSKDAPKLGVNVVNTLMAYADSELKDAAADVLRFFVSDEGYMIFAVKGLRAPFGARGAALDYVLESFEGAPYDSISKTFLYSSDGNVSFPIDAYTFELVAAYGGEQDAVNSGMETVEELLQMLQEVSDEILD